MGKRFRMRLDINKNELKVSMDGVTVQLLPKEFALFQFLYRNRGHYFTREQLLDQVWPLEYPVERTVDDHIYRLRKKLALFSGVEIKTVRGSGYGLAPRDSEEYFPTSQDIEVHDSMHDILRKYHLYGQGRSMMVLAREQDTLGYKLDSFYSSYVHFVQGDLQWLLQTDNVPLQERFYWALLFYMFSGDPKDKLVICEQVLEKKLLSPVQHREMEILNILDLYALAGMPEKALERLKLSYHVLTDPEYENFIPQTKITELFVHLVAGSEERMLQSMADEIEGKILPAKPFLRENGNYKIVKGLWRLRQEAWYDAENLLDEGLQVLENSGFVPMYLYALYRINHFCELFPPKERIREKYANLYDDELERLGLNKLIPQMNALIQKGLNRL
ncbi:winged helix-turn-helix domain-containing protein [Paenibacillus puldeungensis]|uniref:Winged helix-turn-helix domain-containing protein n=1 Tax=Paenibacillus puldeungensis TaxID=696536 RepID=A0ABW3RYC9_9BACL